MIHNNEHSKETILGGGFMGLIRPIIPPSNLLVYEYVFYNPTLDSWPNRVKTDFQKGHMRAHRLLIKGFASIQQHPVLFRPNLFLIGGRETKLCRLWGNPT